MLPRRGPSSGPASSRHLTVNARRPKMTSSFPPSRRSSRGFTLIELMITVAIVAILARIAVPSYLDYVKRGKLQEATATLTSLSLAMNQWYQDNRTFTNSAGSATTCPITMPSGTTYNFTYSCSGLSTTAFTLTATGNTGTSVASFVYTLQQDGTRATTPPSSWSWPSSTSCWIMSKSGTCA
jgi:type IV pilus assembly protein PilE